MSVTNTTELSTQLIIVPHTPPPPQIHTSTHTVLVNKVQTISEILFILANPGEMLHSFAFNLGLHCLYRYLFTSMKATKG